MRKLGVIIFVLLSLSSCKKEKVTVVKNNKQEILNPTKYFSIPTNLNNLKNIKKKSINDTLTMVSGDFEIYKITGYVNQHNQKIGWWNIVNKVDANADNVRLQYRIIDKKEYLNQYIFYNSKEGVYKVNSLFYLSEVLTNNRIKYKFYTSNKRNKINSTASLFTYILLNNKIVGKLDLKCKKENNYFYVILHIPKEREIIINGLFEEGYQYEDGEMGVNDLYILDTIK